MSKKLGTIEGFWDCPYCDTKGIGGLKQSCPNCGRTRGEDTKFYVKETNNFIEHKSSGPDWFCNACGSYNSCSVTVCKSCGASRDESSKDYFSKRREIVNSYVDSSEVSEDESSYMSSSYENNEDTTKPKNFLGSKWLKILGLSLALIGIIITAILAIIPKNKTITVTDTAWERSVQIEEYKLVEDSDWSLPSDAVELIKKEKEIHHYDKVFDHYETVSEQKSREVLDGYDTYTTYEDNGDGTFDVVEHKTPRYKTEYYTETHQEPVYRNEPVYKTKYYYTIWKWVYARTIDAKGNSKPYWPDVKYSKNEREGKKTEKYFVSGVVKKKEKKYQCKYDIWKQFERNKTYQVKTQGKIIIEISDNHA